MLTVNPNKRITAAEALKHPWICVSIAQCLAKCFTKTLKFLFYKFNGIISFMKLILLLAAKRACGFSGSSPRDCGLSQEIQCSS